MVARSIKRRLKQIGLPQSAGRRIRRSAEHYEQATVFNYCRIKALQDPRYKAIMSTPNAGQRTPIAALWMYQEGLAKGFPDISVLIPTKKYHGLFIEMKIKPNVVMPTQWEWLDRLESLGYLTAICWSARQAIDLIDEYIADKDDNKLQALLGRPPYGWHPTTGGAIVKADGVPLNAPRGYRRGRPLMFVENPSKAEEPQKD